MPPDAAIESDLSAADRLSADERQLVQRAAVTCALLEDMEACWLLGKPIDAAQYTTLTNSFRRLLETVGLKRVARDALAQRILEPRTRRQIGHPLSRPNRRRGPR